MTRAPRLVANACLGLLLAGCGQPEQPITRTIPKAAANAAATQAATPASQPMPANPTLVAQAGAIGQPTFPATPAGWTALEPGPMRKGSWKVSVGEASAELAVTAFPGDVGGRMANINRWRGQLGLEPGTAEMYDAIQVAPVGDAQGELVGIWSKDRSRATLAIMARKGDTSWFLKLSGDAAAVEAARSDLLKFAAQTRLP